jgi:hypothetical protein
MRITKRSKQKDVDRPPPACWSFGTVRAPAAQRQLSRAVCCRRLDGAGPQTPDAQTAGRPREQQVVLPREPRPPPLPAWRGPNARRGSREPTLLRPASASSEHGNPAAASGPRDLPGTRDTAAMSTLLKAGDSEPEQPLREGWLVKQSGGASTRARRRSVGEIMKKWDERYFVLTTQRLYYFKTMEVRAAPLWRCLVSPMPYPSLRLGAAPTAARAR